MSHITIILKRSARISADGEATEVEYDYVLPVPHEATPQQVGELVRKAYKRLESSDD